MRIVLDENVDVALKRYLISLGHRADTSKDAGLQGLENGEFLAKARQDYDLLITNERIFNYKGILGLRQPSGSFSLGSDQRASRSSSRRFSASSPAKRQISS